MYTETDLPDTSMLLIDECCICGSSPVTIGLFGYAWCGQCSHRRSLLACGARQSYPALRSTSSEGVTYALGEGLFHWLTTALCGTDMYVQTMLQALNEQVTQQSTNVQATR